MMVPDFKEPNTHYFQQPNDIFRVFVNDLNTDEPHLLSPDGIYCKRCAIQLQAYFKARRPDLTTQIGKVKKKNIDDPNLKHKGGGVYQYHFVLIAKIGKNEFVFDPFLFTQYDQGILKDEYINIAFLNPTDAIWSVS